jgi:SAM-dependent methyltransferase
MTRAANPPRNSAQPGFEGTILPNVSKKKSEELDKIANGYDPSNPSEFFDYWFKRFEADALKPWLYGKNVLELGGATGESAFLISPSCEHYLIVEGSRINCEIIQQRIPKVKVVEAFWEDFQPDSLFSDIILFETLEHYSDPVLLLERSRKWLTPNGRIHISVPNGESLHRQVAVAMGMQSTPTEVNPGDMSQGHLRNYSLDTLTSDVVSAGLKIVYSRGLFLKLVPNAMMLQWNQELLYGINAISERRIADAAELFLVCEAQ